MLFEDAKELLEENNLYIAVEGKTHSDEIEEDRIISQHPEKGTMVNPEYTVRVVLSLGPETVLVPDVEKNTKREAEKDLENQGLTLGEHEYRNSEYPSDTVIGQSIPPNTEVPKGTEISLIISLGPEEKLVTVGNYIGQKLDVAKQMINGDKLKLNKVSERYSDTASKGTVIEQSLAPGETVSEFRSIDLVVSLGPEPAYPKDINIDLSV